MHIAGKDFPKGFLHDMFKPTLRPSFPQGLPTPLYLPYGHFWRNLLQGLPIPWAYLEAITGKAFQRASYTIPTFFLSDYYLPYGHYCQSFPQGLPTPLYLPYGHFGKIFPKGFLHRGLTLRPLMAESTPTDSYTICLPCGHCRQSSTSPLLAVFRRGIPAQQTYLLPILIEVFSEGIPVAPALCVPVSHPVPDEVGFTRVGHVISVGDIRCERSVSQASGRTKRQGQQRPEDRKQSKHDIMHCSLHVALMSLALHYAVFVGSCSLSH